MRANRARDTGPELAVRRLLHARGLRYRVCVRPVPALRRAADIVFTRARIAVFIDGCFWHGCDDHFVEPKGNAEYWAQKIAANRSRDLSTNAAVEAAGWKVLRFWEHECPETVSEIVARAVMKAREAT